MRVEAERLYPNCSRVTRTVAVGGLTKSELLREFQKRSISMNAQARRLFADARFTESGVRYSLETVELRVGDLGFSDGATSAEIFERAGEVGLGLCPLEAGAYLRLQYREQPKGGRIIIASPGPPEGTGAPNGFYLRRLDGGLWLRGYTASADYVWGAEERFVFCVVEG